MELVKKTTILFPPSLYKLLSRLAKQRRESIGQLVRKACEEKYGGTSLEERLAAVEKIRRMSLPVGTPAQMKRESVPDPEDLLP